MIRSLCLILLSTAALAQPTLDDPLKSLRAQHPRLMALNDDIARVKQFIASDAQANAWFEDLRNQADAILDDKPIVHKLIGPRLLDKSRTCLHRVSTCAGIYRLTGEKKYAERAIKEMLTAAAFPDWNPKHFLDTAEMSAALGIGYDWLHDVISAKDRATIRKALVELGLNEGLKVYEADRWWTRAVHNWNQVCNGGMTVGALAIADEEPQLAKKIVVAARKSIPRAMASFAPDGGWNEGPGYWSYTNRYTTFYIAALESAIGSDLGIKSSQGFPETGHFRMHFISPIDQTFNYADAGENAGDDYAMMWLARAINKPEYAAHERWRTKKPTIFHLLWFDNRETWPKKDYPLDALYKGVDVVFMRTAWADKNAIWLGFKGGDNQANHSHLDLGTFNLDAAGQRWAKDLGGDDYNMPGYFGAQRWTYYRLRTEGHNTLTIDDDNQNPKAKAPIIEFKSEPSRATAVADLTAAYADKLDKWHRTVTMLAIGHESDRNGVVITDTVVAKAPVKVVWNFHTNAQIELITQNRRAILTKSGQRLAMTINSPGGEFKIVSANPEPPQNPNKGSSNLTIQFPDKLKEATIEVVLAPMPKQ